MTYECRKTLMIWKLICLYGSKRTIYYQVAATVRDEKTLKRELLPLQRSMTIIKRFVNTG